MSAPAGLVDGLLAGRYRLTSRLGAGGVGEVWRARDLRLDRDVAVKTLRPEVADDDGARERFRSEARSTGRLSDPGIAAVYDAGEDDARAWLVLELVEGESLQALLRRSGRLSPERTLDVVAQTAAALHAAHECGVVHRDVKPGNLLLRTDGTLKVTDFGIASVAGSPRLTCTGQVVGTPAYLSPEQAAGGDATARSDLYALGIVAYECLTGSVPYPYDEPVAVLLAHTRTPPPPLPAEVPPPVQELVDALLAKDPQRRPATAREVARRAEAVRASLPRPGTVAPEESVASPARPDVTAVLPAPGTRPPLLVRPAPPARRPPRAGLAGRPGQRRAVRVTALLLGLLAVALGWRESSGDVAGPAAGRSPAADSSAVPSSPAAETSSGGSAPALPATAGRARVVPGEQAVHGGPDVAPRPQAPQREPGPQQRPPAEDADGRGAEAAQDGAPGAVDRVTGTAGRTAEQPRTAPGRGGNAGGTGKAGTAGKGAKGGEAGKGGKAADQRRPGGAERSRGNGGGEGKSG